MSLFDTPPYPDAEPIAKRMRELSLEREMTELLDQRQARLAKENADLREQLRLAEARADAADDEAQKWADLAQKYGAWTSVEWESRLALKGSVVIDHELLIGDRKRAMEAIVHVCMNLANQLGNELAGRRRTAK